MRDVQRLREQVIAECGEGADIVLRSEKAALAFGRSLHRDIGERLPAGAYRGQGGPHGALNLGCGAKFLHRQAWLGTRSAPGLRACVANDDWLAGARAGRILHLGYTLVR